MKIARRLGILLISIVLLPSAALAADLMQIYRQALASDPTFKAAQAQYYATQENVPINRAALLPNINLSGDTERQRIREGSFVNDSNQFGIVTDRRFNTQTFYNNSNNYLLQATQTIFNYSAWAQLQQADFQVRQAAATFAAAAQDLMLRTAQAYFGVLQASDTLRYTQEQKKAVAEQLRQTQDQYNVGLVAITGVKEAQANYDSLVAQEIAAKNDLANAIEQLRTITGRTYIGLMGADNRLPLVNPQPDNIERWVEVAQCQNYDLLAAINGANAAQQNIKVQSGGHLPVVNAIAGYNYDDESDPNTLGENKTETTFGGFTLNFPIYQGGLVNAQTEQARYLYQQAISQMEFTHRSVIQQTRDAYLGVISGIGKITADRQNVIAQEVSLRATREGYAVGTRTILDVLNVQTSLYQAQKQYSQDQYNYLVSILSLKQAAATLTPNDLAQMNSWLQQPVPIASKVADIGQGYQSGFIPPPTHKTVHGQSSKAKQAMMPAPQALSEYYTVVLFDAKVQQHAQNFMLKQNLPGKVHYIVQKNQQGEKRYLVVYGHYTTKQQAQKALAKLPASVQKLQPWVKRVE
jgi:outer membrane protein